MIKLQQLSNTKNCWLLLGLLASYHHSWTETGPKFGPATVPSQRAVSPAVATPPPVATDLLEAELALLAQPEQTVATVLPATTTAQPQRRRGQGRKSPLKKLLFETKLFTELNEQELASRCQEHLAINDYRAAALCTEREITLCKEPHRLRELRLKRADYWRLAPDVEKAASAYREFIAQYPSDRQTEAAKYQLIEILYDAMPVCNRDQSGTHEALQMAQSFLANPAYQKHRLAVERMAERCRRQLLDAEIKIFEFYVNHQHLTAAQKRLHYIEQNFSEFSTQIAVLQTWFTAAEQGQSFSLPVNMRSKSSRKRSYKF